MSESVRRYILDNWLIDKDAENNGKTIGFDKRVSDSAVPVVIPSIIQETFPDYHGVAFYWCRFIPKISFEKGDRLLLCFSAADYKAEVFLNGEYIGEHETGETPFKFDVTEKVKLCEENLLSVRVVNPTLDDIDGLNMVNIPNRNKAFRNTAGSCTNHGGLWGDVEIVSVPSVYMDDAFLTGDIHTGTLKVSVDIFNKTDENTKVTLYADVYARYGKCGKIVGTEKTFVCEKGSFVEEISLTVPDFKLWDIDDPNLYRVEIGLKSEFGTDSRVENFGFREFLVKDGYFFLNGRKIFLKSSHTGNAFPVGQGYPAIKDQIRKDMIMAKSYGFNMVRAISGMLRKEQLEVCDEIGLMVYEECFAAWDLGLGFFLPEAGLDRVGDEELMLKRFDYNTLEMIKRDRNHPCVTVWGLLNEMNSEYPVVRRAKEILPKLRKIDPTRLVLFGSGRWDKYDDIGSGSNPYSDTWDVLMGGDMTDIENLGDMHFYPRFPFCNEDIDCIRNYCKDLKPAFFSESGMGPLFNVIEEAKHYEQYGYRSDLEDYVWIKSQAEKLEEDWRRLGLCKVYPCAEMMLKESQRLSAEDRRRIFDAVRSNPKFNGYSLTGLLDHGWCGEGLWSLWRRFKPEVYDAVCDGWAPLRFCLFVRTHVQSDEDFEIEAVLANECVLKEGTYTADFAVTGKYGTVMMWSETFEITDDSFAVPIMKKNIRLDVPSGKYSLTAYMDGASPLGNKFDFYVTNADDIPVSDATVSTVGLSRKTTDFIKSRGVKIVSDSDVFIVGKDVDPTEIKELKERAEKGAKVLFLNCRDMSDECVKALNNPSVEIADMWNWLYHKEPILANREIFKGIGYGVADQKVTGNLVNRKCFMTSDVPDDVVCPAFYTGYHGIDGSYGCVHDALGIKVGDGFVYLNALDIEGTLDTEPAAKILLMNFIDYLNE